MFNFGLAKLPWWGKSLIFLLAWPILIGLWIWKSFQKPAWKVGGVTIWSILVLTAGASAGPAPQTTTNQSLEASLSSSSAVDQSSQSQVSTPSQELTSSSMPSSSPSIPDNTTDQAASMASTANIPDSSGSQSLCDSSYPDICLRSGPDLDCDDIPNKNFKVVGADPHGLDRDKDGIGCETTASNKIGSSTGNSKSTSASSQSSSSTTNSVVSSSKPSSSTAPTSGYISGTCEYLKSIGLGNFTPGNPNYTPARDRDKDGIACEL